MSTLRGAISIKHGFDATARVVDGRLQAKVPVVDCLERCCCSPVITDYLHAGFRVRGCLLKPIAGHRADMAVRPG